MSDDVQSLRLLLSAFTTSTFVNYIDVIKLNATEIHIILSFKLNWQLRVIDNIKNAFLSLYFNQYCIYNQHLFFILNLVT